MARSSNPSRYRLANRILDLIRDARFEVGHHLREQQLGDLVGVSRTPIRMALGLLASEGIVEARRNQGFFLLKPFDQLHRIEIDVPSSADHELYERLVKDRLAGTIPNSLTQSEIARRYVVDRVVMMRTLSRLAEDGLVTRNKGHGWTFLPTLDSVLTLNSSYDFRLTMEPSIFLLRTFKPDAAALERARLQHVHFVSHPNIASIGGVQLFEADAAFHEMFAAFSGNVFFLQAIQQQNRLRRLLEFSGYTNRRRIRDWCKEHLAIIDAVSEGDFAAASQFMHEHLTHAYAAAPAIVDANSRAPNPEIAARPGPLQL
ncbi:transcriptional regulator, GntR family [Rhizobiales bacterium GAS188]|nr:transcriptional regulator, GntR family [Rhizobiales bacterium GAS188]